MPISYQAISRSDAGHVIYGSRLIREDDFQPLYNPETFSILPGTVITYDWENERVLGPVLLSDDMDPNIFQNWLRNSRTDITSAAGFSSRFASQLGEVGLTRFDATQLICGSGSTSAAPQVESSEAKAKEGN